MRRKGGDGSRVFQRGLTSRGGEQVTKKRNLGDSKLALGEAIGEVVHM